MRRFTNLDFTLGKYEQLCDAMCSHGYIVTTVAGYFDNHDTRQKVIVLRHDVDLVSSRALRMARVEHNFGIKATYYFRFNRRAFQPHLVREIASMGHEIGYHYEVLDKAKGNYEEAIHTFGYELEQIRKVAEVKTICMHGNPLTKWDNRALWRKYNFKEFGLLGEAYLSFNDITYFSDTGRTWSGRNNVKDWFPPAQDVGGNLEHVVITSTDNVIDLIKKGQLEQVYLLVHPDRWSDNLLRWSADLMKDMARNTAKRLFGLRRQELQDINDEY